MKWRLFCLVFALCGVSFAHADEQIRSLQQTLKSQGFYYGKVTGDKNAETTTAIRRYQIRNGLPVTGEFNEETSRSVESTSQSNSVAITSRPASKPAVTQPNSVHLDARGRVSGSSPFASFSQTDHPLEANAPYATSFYQSAPVRVNRRIIAGAQYQLMSRGYYRGRVDGRHGRQMAFAVRAFQSSAGLPPTGRLDMHTLDALGSSESSFAYSAPPPGNSAAWMPLKKSRHGKWKMQ